MNKEVPISLVVGCGENGLRWADRQNKEENIVCLDEQNINSLNPNFINGDVLNLPFDDKSINRIYADFILNPLHVKDFTIKEIINNPSVLKKEIFPKMVRDWYTYTLGESDEKVKNNLEKIRWLLRTQALSEMMRVTKTNGEIFIIDRPFILDWIEAKAINILEINPANINIIKLELNSDDYDRSGSVRMIKKEGEPLDKIVIKKIN